MHTIHHARASMLGFFDHAAGYDRIASRVFRRLYARVAADVAAAGLADGGRVLDVGTGPGQVPLRIADARPRLQLDGLDLSADMIERARHNATVGGVADRMSFTVGDVAALPYPDAAFDLVVSTMSQHHWPDADAGLRELRRVLRPAGQVWIYDLRIALRRAEAAARAAFPGHVVCRETVRTGRLPLRFIGRLVIRPS
jgi:ubiquinone/menaquinone biosynthesis C-methylase UbiE